MENIFGFVQTGSTGAVSLGDAAASQARLLSPQSLSWTSLRTNPHAGGFVTQALRRWGRVRGGSNRVDR